MVRPLQGVDARQEEVEKDRLMRGTDAIRRLTTRVQVTQALVLPSIASGVVLTFARALGEFGATLTFAGSLAGTTRTLPLEIYLRNETDPQAAVALSLVLLAAAAIIVSGVYGVRAWRR